MAGTTTTTMSTATTAALSNNSTFEEQLEPLNNNSVVSTASSTHTTSSNSVVEQERVLLQKSSSTVEEDIFENKNSSLFLDTSLWKQSFEDKLSEEDETKNFVNLDYSTLNHQQQFTNSEYIGGQPPNPSPGVPNTPQQNNNNNNNNNTKTEGLSSIFGTPHLDESNYNNCLDVLFYPEELFPPESTALSHPAEDPQTPDFLSSSDITPVSNIIEDMGDLPFVPLENVDSVNSVREKGPPSHMADVLLSLKNPLVHPDSPPAESWQSSPAFDTDSSQQNMPHSSLQDSNSLYNSSYGENPWTSPGNHAHHHHQQQQPQHDFFPASMSVNVSMNMTVGVSPSHFSPYGFQEPSLETNSNWNSAYSGGSNGHCGYSSSSSTSSTSSNIQHQNGGYFGGGGLIYGEGPTAGSKEEEYHGKRIGNTPYLNSRPNRCYASNFDEHKILKDPSSPDSSTDNTKNVCGICGKTYARPSTLKTHMRTHSGERPYRCYDCDKSFSQAANLTAHCRTHSGEKPFHCSICNRKFSQSSSVTTHMRTHSGERPYRCRMCKKAFSDSSTLTKHLRIHSGEKPYQCKLCHLKFSQSGNLNRHMRIHAQNGR